MLNLIDIPGCIGVSPKPLTEDEYILYFVDSVRDMTNDEIKFYKKKIRIEQLKQETKTAIESGFYSSALGVPHTYDSKLPQDQINLLGAVLKNVDIMFTCINENGIKKQRLHTPAQIRKVMSDGGDWISTNQAKFYAQVDLL
jgi:hypothetical protein